MQGARHEGTDVHPHEDRQPRTRAETGGVFKTRRGTCLTERGQKIEPKGANSFLGLGKNNDKKTPVFTGPWFSSTLKKGHRGVPMVR